jgi:hypothetical protein
MIPFYEQQAEKVSRSNQVHVSYRKDDLEEKIMMSEVKQGAIAVNNSSDGIPQVKEQFHGNEPDHQPISESLPFEQEQL